MGKIWVSSDPHFCHNKEFLYKPRGFNNISEMNEKIIENWNSVVSNDDEVFLLGDIMLNDNAEGCRCLDRLNGKIYILTGNHDTATRIQEYVNIRPTILHLGLAYILRYNGYRFYLSHYPTLCGNIGEDNKILKKKMINICGHSHVKDPFFHWDQGIIFHSELDTNNCKPWLIDDIIELLEKKYNNVPVESY